MSVETSTGTPITAEHAYGLGFANEITEAGEALTAALEMAQLVCRGAPISVQEGLVALERVHSADDDFAWQVTEEAIANTLSSQDTAEGIQAFLERREPRWSGRETRTTGSSLHN